MRAAFFVSVAALAALVACGGGRDRPRTDPGAAKPPAASLSAARPCLGLPAVRCATLTVPLDHSGRVRGTLGLRVALAGPARAPRGVLVFLTGGPGQPGVRFVPRVTSRLAAPLRGYRIVMLDQRGTGPDALQCPELQREVGSSDLTLPTPAAVRSCAAEIGPDRRFFSTADVVADLNDLQTALGAPKITLDGVSYGSFVAERYALAHPGRVARLVLDSVVPHDGYDPLDLVPLRATARVLRLACAAAHCATDPAADLAAVVRRYHDGAELLDTLTAFSIAVPSFGPLPAALHAARQGHPRALRSLIDDVRLGQQAPASALSQGLHASTLCADDPAPWGGPATPFGRRPAALARAIVGLKAADTFPFDRATVAANGTLQTCLEWPPTPTPAAPTARDLPPVPALLLAGDHDLSTPLEWARQEAAVAPRGQLVVVPGAGHSVQLRAKSDAGRLALARFLRSG